MSTVSVANCLGRVLIGKCEDARLLGATTDSLSLGMTADFAKNQLQLPRSLCISLVAALFIISQLVVYKIDHVSDLWKGSALLGLAYGGMFGLFPTIVIEWFGLRGYLRLKNRKLKLTIDPDSAFFGELGFCVVITRDWRQRLLHCIWEKPGCSQSGSPSRHD